MDLKSRLHARSQEIKQDIIGLRRHLHAHPELAFEEWETSNLVKRELASAEIEFTDGIAKTGVVGYIHGGLGPGKTIALRADMDALPILETNQVPYASKVPGKMHACGHDVHTSSLLGTARLLQENRGAFAGTVKLIFQPSEEKLPGGASVMIAEGVLDNPRVSSIFGQHVMPGIPAGKVGMRRGIYMASADEIYLRIRGKGGHGAMPQACVDPVAIMAQTLSTLQTVVSRMADPRLPSVLTFGKVIANGATNVIPDEVYLEGTYRCMDEPQRARAHKMIESICREVASAMGGKAEIEIMKGYPVLVNDDVLGERARTWVEDYVGAENVQDLDLWMAAEDFAWYTHQVPGCFYRLGTRNEDRGIIHGVHTPQFDVDESALGLSTGLMAWLAIQELQHG
ncbi:MAG: M20 family metallopeptidase [Bacteroidia bacterium]